MSKKRPWMPSYQQTLNRSAPNVGPSRAGFTDRASENSVLRDLGFAPCVWGSTEQTLREHGIQLVQSEAFVQPGRITGQLTTAAKRAWGPRWAVLVAEADPCSEAAKEWALARAVKDEEFRDSLDTIARLAETEVRRRMAEFLHEMWEPTDE